MQVAAVVTTAWQTEIFATSHCSAILFWCGLLTDAGRTIRHSPARPMPFGTAFCVMTSSECGERFASDAPGTCSRQERCKVTRQRQSPPRWRAGSVFFRTSTNFTAGWAATARAYGGAVTRITLNRVNLKASFHAGS
jgi:hypothetical protein